MTIADLLDPRHCHHNVCNSSPPAMQRAVERGAQGHSSCCACLQLVVLLPLLVGVVVLACNFDLVALLLGMDMLALNLLLDAYESVQLWWILGNFKF